MGRAAATEGSQPCARPSRPLFVLVPRSRVQHLDVERGPLERQFALATLVVHTAGTQTAALRLSGLDDHDAVALRDALIPDATQHADAL